MITEIKDYKDLMKKIKYDIERYQKDNNVYILIDCLMSLSSLPEWIFKNENAPEKLRKIAKEKLHLMQGLDFVLNEKEINNNIDHKLRFIRLYCNQTKHNDKKDELPQIVSRDGSYLAANLPIKFDNYIAIGEQEIDAEHLINDVYDFWNKLINE